MPFIEYESLSFKNAYIYRECEIPLAKQGLVLIRGLNLDDGGFLGAGKSSLFEMFAQLQMGKGGKLDKRQGDKRSEIVNSFVGKDLSASLKFRVEGHPYEIRQYRDHYRYKNQLHVIDRVTGDNVLPNGLGAYPHKWIRSTLLKLDETSFFNLVYLVQELNNVMVHGSESDRRTRLTVMFNLDIYDELRKIAKKTLSLSKTTLSDIEGVRSELDEVEQKIESMPTLSELEAELDEAQDTLDSYQEGYDEDAESFTELTELLASLKRKSEIRAEIKSKFKDSTLSRVYDNPTSIKKDQVRVWKQQHDNAAAQLISKKRDRMNLERRNELQHKLKSLSDRDVDEVQEELTEVTVTLANLMKVELPQAQERRSLLVKIDNIVEPGDNLDELEEALRDSLSREGELTRSIAGLSAELRDAACPTCHRPFDMDEQEIASKKLELDGLRRDLSDLTDTISELKVDVSNSKTLRRLQNMLANLETERTPEEVKEDIREYTNQQSVLSEELRTARQREQIEAELSLLPAGSLSSLNDDIARIRRESERFRERYEAARYILQRLSEMSKLPKGNKKETAQKARDLRQRMKGSSGRIAEAGGNVERLKNRLRDLRLLRRRRASLTDAIETRDAVINENQCLNALYKSFSSGGLKQDRFQSILRDAATRTVPGYVDILWPNRNVKLQISDRDGSLYFQLHRVDTDSVTSSNLLSGGERHKSGLAFLFGMRDLKEIYTGSATNILIVDEPFGNLDPLGTEGLISIFSRLKQKFDSIFVISHRPEVLSHPIWDQTWWAVREDNNATLYRNNLPAEYAQSAAELVKQ